MSDHITELNQLQTGFVDRFLEQWKSDTPPAIEKYLEGITDEADRERVLPSLLAIDIQHRKRSLDAAPLEYYQQRIPQLSHLDTESAKVLFQQASEGPSTTGEPGPWSHDILVRRIREAIDRPVKNISDTSKLEATYTSMLDGETPFGSHDGKRRQAGQSATTPQPEDNGPRFIGPYKLIRKIGEGCSFQFARRYSTPIKKGLFIVTLNLPMFWSRCAMARQFRK